jgi:hypothetical protein
LTRLEFAFGWSQELEAIIQGWNECRKQRPDTLKSAT